MNRINIDQPRWDQSVYLGRFRHFLIVTNPLNVLHSSSSLEKAKDIVTRYRNGEDLEISEEELWKAKSTYDSAYHPETGKIMNPIGRMSAQVPMNMSITGCMLTFYKRSSAVFFWQVINQTFNAIVNNTNRSGGTLPSRDEIRMSYILGVSGAVVAALTLNNLVKTMPPLVGRLVPFCAVAAANCINIPMIRRQEMTKGIPVVDDNGNTVGASTIAAKRAIGAVCISRLLMAAPGMVIPPLIMNMLEKRGHLKKMPWISAPLQIALCGILLTFATPACCAVFPQRASIRVDKLEEELQKKIRELPNSPEVVYYNKGL